MADPVNNIPAAAIDPLRGTPAPQASPAGTQQVAGPSFQEILADLSQAGSLKFSKHALQRIQRREIAPDSEQLSRLNQGAELASSKGSRSSAVLVDDMAFIVAVPARTVVTAINRQQMREQIFTNIDSVVLV